MNSLAPEVMKAFLAFDKAAVAEGAIPVKYKELIAAAALRAGGAITHATHALTN
jgi:alkylhydroperoxidase/carboxymuconolactone decarboxylase family protein YurZ